VCATEDGWSGGHGGKPGGGLGVKYAARHGAGISVKCKRRGVKCESSSD
jgi:hypothetical protein